jgi:hypothetical protein
MEAFFHHVRPATGILAAGVLVRLPRLPCGEESAGRMAAIRCGFSHSNYRNNLVVARLGMFESKCSEAL